MAQVINTNVMSLNAQRNLNTSSASMATTIQRLSSGLRINSAKDDAAGLAISERFTTQIRGLDVASRNANDGISLAQTAEGALGTIGNNLQRIRELAVQSRNATNSDSDRDALQAEVTQLKSEIDRVAKQTSFNGTSLLDGSFTNKTFQVGANQGQTIDIAQITNASIGQLGSWKSVDTAAKVSGSAANGTGYVAAIDGNAASKAVGSVTTPSAGGDGTSTFTQTFVAGSDTATVMVTGAVTNTTLAAAYASTFGDDGQTGSNGFTLDLGGAASIESALTSGTLNVVRADGVNFTAPAATTGGTAYTTDPVATTDSAATTNGVVPVAGTAGTFSEGSFTIGSTNISFGAATSAAGRASDLVKAINAKTAESGVTASLVDGKLSLKSTTGDIVIGGADLAETGLTNGTTAGTSNAFAAGTDKTGFSGLDISTEDGADNAILAMDAALDEVNSARADLGAIQNRFTSVVSNLSTTSENLTDSRSRIRDADYAKETAELTRTQILQQAGTAMLAQAKSVPQNVLSLLQ